MNWHVGGLAVVVSVTALAAAPMAQGEPVPCGKRTELLAHFQQSYREVPNVVGLTTDGRLIEVVVAPSGSWTMLLTPPGEQSCVIATGQDWQNIVATLDPAV